MQKIGMLQAFVELDETGDATFVHPEGNADQSRLIKMRILAEKPVNLFIVPVEYDYIEGTVTEHHDSDDFIRFLTHVEAGMEQIEFYWQGSFCLRFKPTGAMEGEAVRIWLDTYDNTAFNVEASDPTSFARLWEREERDPRILEIERAARHNQMRLQAQMEADRAEFANMLSEMKKNVPPAASAPVTPAASTPAPSASVPSASDQQPDPAAANGNGGNA